MIDERAGALTVKVNPLLAIPETVTTILPVVPPVGTGTVMLPGPQLMGAPAIPLNVTVLVPCAAPKFTPVIETEAPTAPDVGDKLLRTGGKLIVTPLLGTP
jgi:hypothetical protein